MKKFNLAMPKALYQEVRRVADAELTTATEIMKKAIRFWVWLYDQLKSGNKIFIRDDNGKEREVLIF